MTWSGLEIAVVLGLFGVSITIFVVGIVCPSATRPRAKHRSIQSQTRLPRSSGRRDSSHEPGGG